MTSESSRASHREPVVPRVENGQLHPLYSLSASLTCSSVVPSSKLKFVKRIRHHLIKARDGNEDSLLERTRYSVSTDISSEEIDRDIQRISQLLEWADCRDSRVISCGWASLEFLMIYRKYYPDRSLVGWDVKWFMRNALLSELVFYEYYWVWQDFEGYLVSETEKIALSALYSLEMGLSKAGRDKVLLSEEMRALLRLTRDGKRMIAHQIGPEEVNANRIYYTNLLEMIDFVF